MASVVVTVGMGRWPFDRLVQAADRLGADHDVFIQTGTSQLRPRCEHQAWVAPEELQRRMLDADVVITHAGNTVRWLQRRGRTPVAVARHGDRGEMGNDHQVTYLRVEQERGRVIAVWDVDELAGVVERHADLAAGVSHRLVPAVVDPVDLIDRLDALVAVDAAADAADAADDDDAPGSPFQAHPTRRYDFAWHRLRDTDGAHLDLGCNTGEFLDAVLRGTALRAVGVDANDEVLATARGNGLPVVRTDRWGRLPFAAGTFSSATALDVLEHVPDESRVLAELHRVLAPGGTLIAAVPAAHALSVLDPDNAKLRFPRLHGAVYRARFGERRYRERFIELDDGYRGDLAVERHDHTNYRPGDFLSLLDRAGFVPTERSGANLLWRLWHPLSLLGGDRLARAADRMTLLDGRWFSSANLFVVARAR